MPRKSTSARTTALWKILQVQARTLEDLYNQINELQTVVNALKASNGQQSPTVAVKPETLGVRLLERSTKQNSPGED